MKEKILKKNKEHFPSSLESVIEFRGELSLVIKKSDIVNVCQLLRDDSEMSFDLLVDVCGVDCARQTDRFEVIYNLYSLKNKFRLRLKVKVDESDLHVPTVTNIWHSANWNERETYDMFGILFDGHPDLRRIYMPEEFEHFPLRKDFPLMGIPGSLSLPRK
jgi:NADH-quinone oxidoreductase subunit C